MPATAAYDNATEEKGMVTSKWFHRNQKDVGTMLAWEEKKQQNHNLSSCHISENRYQQLIIDWSRHYFQDIPTILIVTHNIVC